MPNIEFLADLPIFRGTSDDERSQLLSIMKRETFAAGKNIIESAESTKALYIITEGSAAVILDVYSMQNPAISEAQEVIEQTEVAQMEVGSIFGEVAFFHRGPATATVRAITKLETLALYCSDYQSLLKAGNLAAYKLAVNAAHILSERLRSADKLIEELVLAQHDSAVRSMWSRNHASVHSSPILPRYFLHVD